MFTTHFSLLIVLNPARRFAPRPLGKETVLFLRTETTLSCGLPFARGVPVGRRVENSAKWKMEKCKIVSKVSGFNV